MRGRGAAAQVRVRPRRARAGCVMLSPGATHPDSVAAGYLASARAPARTGAVRA